MVELTDLFMNISYEHRYQKSKTDCLRFVMRPLLTLVFQGFFFFSSAVTINSTNEANKAGGTRF
jgi:hypothetical protein